MLTMILYAKCNSKLVKSLISDLFPRHIQERIFNLYSITLFIAVGALHIISYICIENV